MTFRLQFKKGQERGFVLFFQVFTSIATALYFHCRMLSAKR